MNNSELNKILKQAQVPEQPAEYWEEFPKRALAAIESQERQPGTPILRPVSKWPSLRWPVLAVGGAAVCILLGFAVGFWKGSRSFGEQAQMADLQKYFREIEGLFPNQVEAIVLDAKGAHLVLAEQANVPVSPPVYVKICGPKGCQRFITFSGQRIRVNGDLFDVLIDRQGDVLLVGAQSVWSSSQPAVRAGQYRIEARPLRANS